VHVFVSFPSLSLIPVAGSCALDAWPESGTPIGVTGLDFVDTKNAVLPHFAGNTHVPPLDPPQGVPPAVFPQWNSLINTSCTPSVSTCSSLYQSFTVAPEKFVMHPADGSNARNTSLSLKLTPGRPVLPGVTG
jgi:hypothetical protein